MEFLRAIVLGLIQGLTEFIPVSSSAHLVLAPWAFGWPRAGLAFDTVLHWGTLLAVLIYFWHDWLAIAHGFVQSVLGPPRSLGARLAGPNSRLAWWIILGTIPAALLGYLFDDFFESLFGNPQAVGAFLLITALILTASERLAQRTRSLDRMSAADALLVGLAQAVAIAPGISRSGATIAAGMGRGLTREAAARFSFLLGAPIILAAGLLQLVDLAQAGRLDDQAPVLLTGFIVAAVTGYFCIRFLLNYLRRGKLYVFAAYCAVVGLITLLFTSL